MFVMSMDKFDIQILLKDGSFADYQVENERGTDSYQVFQQEKPIAKFETSADGSWQILDNTANIDSDLEQRIINQLKGFKG